MPPVSRPDGRLCGVLLVVCACAAPLDAQPVTPSLVSVNAAGTAAGNFGALLAFLSRASVSADGQRVAFASSSNDLAAGDGNGVQADIFVRNRTTNATILVSAALNGASAPGVASWPAIAPGGTLVVFSSTASSLSTGDSNLVSDVFVRNLSTNLTERVSVATNGTQGNLASGSRASAISDDGRYVLFLSRASTLVAAGVDANGLDDLYLRDRVAGTTTLVTVNTAGTAAGAYPVGAPAVHLDTWSMSRNGRYVAFSSRATDLVAGDSNQSVDLFLRDMQAQTTIRLCASPEVASTRVSYSAAAFSGDGRYVAFHCDDGMLSAGDDNGTGDVFRRDLVTGAVAGVSRRSDGLATPDGESTFPAMSFDGRLVLFWSTASDIVAGVGDSHVYVRDMVTGSVTQADVLPAGRPASESASRAAMSDDGRYVVFDSFAAPSPGQLGETFVRDRVAGTTTQLSVNVTGVSGAFPNTLGTNHVGISRDGSTALFESSRTNHSTLPDTNGDPDLFVVAVPQGAGGGTPQLSLQVSDGGALALAGSRIPYVLHYRNTGTGTADAATIRVTVPALGRWARGESTPGWQCAPDGEAGATCTLSVAPLAAGAEGDAAFTVYVDEDARAGGVLGGAPSASAATSRIAASLTPNFNLTGTFGSLFQRETAWAPCTPAEALAGHWSGCCVAYVLLSASAGPTSQNVTQHAASLTATDLETLYTVRDTILRPTPNGQHYADLYYAHLAAVRDTILGNASLLARARAILDDWMPGLAALAGGQGASVTITPARMTTLVSFLQDVAAAAPADLREVILDELTRFPADALAGETLAAAARRLGVHDGGAFTRYFAEGATGAFFRTVLALSNTSATAVDATLRFLTATGQTVEHLLGVPAHGRATLDVGTLPGLTTAEFSTVVTSAAPLTVDRTLTWDRTGYGSHSETSLAAPALTWYLAEGATHSGFDLFYLLQNPDPARSATVTVRYLRPVGAPLSKAYTVAPASRFNIWVNQERFDVGGVPTRLLAATDVSAVFTSTNDVPLIVERALYRSTAALAFGAGHESAGVTAPARQWFLAEGATGDYFDLFVLVANPTDQPAQIRARYLLPSGQVLTKDHTVAANSRFNIWVDREELPAGSGSFPLADTAVSTTIESLNGTPVIVERAMWWPGTAATWYEAHNSPGAIAPGYVWAVADGEVGGPAALETYVLIANVSATAGAAKVTVLFEDGTTATRYVALPANSRNNVSVNDEFTNVAGRRFGVLVESVGAPRALLVVERATYGNANGEIWTSGSNALASRVR